MTRKLIYFILPTILLLLIVELIFRIVVSNGVMKYEDNFLKRNSAFIYWVKNRNKPFERHIRLRENAPNTNVSDRPTKQVLSNSEGLKDTIYNIRVDADGFILPSCCKSDRYIFFLGGSTTACAFMNENNRFAYLVGQKLSQAGFDYNVKNSGVPGNNTMHSLDLLLNKILKYKPEVVVLMEAVNDLTFLMWNGSYYVPHQSRGLIIDEQSMQQESRSVIDEFNRTKKFFKVDTATVFHDYENALKTFIAICRINNVTPVLMTQFNRIENDDMNRINKKNIEDVKKYANLDYVPLYKHMNDIIRKIAAQDSVTLIDLDKLVPKNASYMYDAVHLNDNGSKYVADLIYDHFIKSRILHKK